MKHLDFYEALLDFRNNYFSDSEESFDNAKNCYETIIIEAIESVEKEHPKAVQKMIEYIKNRQSELYKQAA